MRYRQMKRIDIQNLGKLIIIIIIIILAEHIVGYSKAILRMSVAFQGCIVIQGTCLKSIRVCPFKLSPISLIVTTCHASFKKMIHEWDLPTHIYNLSYKTTYVPAVSSAKSSLYPWVYIRLRSFLKLYIAAYKFQLSFLWSIVFRCFISRVRHGTLNTLKMYVYTYRLYT